MYMQKELRDYVHTFPYHRHRDLSKITIIISTIIMNFLFMFNLYFSFSQLI